jgi:hypothetical protein
MARRADTPCAGGCGKLLYQGSTTAGGYGAGAAPTCQACRRARWPRCTRCGEAMLPRPDRALHPICGPCRKIETDQIRRKGERICRICGQSLLLTEFGIDRRYRAGEGLKAAICTRCQNARRNLEAKRRKSQVQGRKRRDARYATWDGVTDRDIYDRDGWRCKMPNTAGNKRAAHLRCNVSDGRKSRI